MKNINGRRSNDYEYLVTGGGRFGGALRRHSCETCYSNSSSSSEKRMSLLSTHDDLFTISSQSPLSAYSSGYYSNANSSLLDSCEMTQQQETTRIWSLRPENLLNHSKFLFSPLLPTIKTRVDFISEEDSSSTSSTLLLIEDEVNKKIDVISMTESFDSGFGGNSSSSAVVIDMVSSPTSSCVNLAAINPVNTNYLVIEQTKPRSLFHYLFDLSHLIRDALFEWPTTYVRKLKENLVSLGSNNRQASIKWRPFSSSSSSSLSKRVRQCAQKINNKTSNNTQSNVIDKPLGIMGLLSKLNLFNLVETFNIFNLFRSTVTAAATNSAVKSSSSSTSASSSSFPYGYNPLRDFLLRLFDINFF